MNVAAALSGIVISADITIVITFKSPAGYWISEAACREKNSLIRSARIKGGPTRSRIVSDFSHTIFFPPATCYSFVVILILLHAQLIIIDVRRHRTP